MRLPFILEETLRLLEKQNEDLPTEVHPYQGLKLHSPFALNIPNQKLHEVQKLLQGIKTELEEQI